MPFGIAFAGGGARGAAHVGVLLALEENNMLPHSVSGTSSGSIVAGLYASGMSPRELKDLVIGLSQKGYYLVDPNYKGIIKSIKEFFSHKPITFSGLIKGNRLERLLYEKCGGRRITDVKMPTVIPSVDLNSGLTFAYTNVAEKDLIPIKRVRWKRDILLSEAIRASCAVPTVFQPKIVEDQCLVDGGVTDVLPVNLLIAAGEKNVLAVDLSEKYKMPDNGNIIEIASHSLSIMSNCLREYISSGEKLLLTPSLPDDAELLSFNRMPECMEAGYDAAIKMLPTIREIFR